MTHQPSPYALPVSAEAGQQVAQLRQVLELVERVAGRGSPPPADAAIDEDARISSGYADALPIVRRRFDALAAEAAAWAAAGVQAIVAARDEAEPPRDAAARLAEEIAATLRRLARTLPGG